MICGKCGKTGHNKRTCGRASKTHRPKATGRPHAAIGIKRKCKKCGKLGHMAKTCDGETASRGCASWKRELARRAAADDDIEYEVIIYDSRKRRRENY